MYQIQDIIAIAKAAGDAILTVYNDPAVSGEVDYKADNSPLTQADQKSNDVIVARLKELTPDIPIISEEEKDTPYAVRKDWQRFWLVDPLDGTKEFIKRNGEFTVNIALIEDRVPVAGVIYVPVTGITYYAEGEAAYKIDKTRKTHKLQVTDKTEGLTAVKSRSHSSDADEQFLSKYDITDSISVGSSLKFCMVAEGKADLYYRSGPTMEWDTGAGQAVLAAAGGVVLRDGEVFTYNKENLLNPGFLCLNAGLRQAEAV